ncbi:MAG: hydrogenase formation protein HypD [Planctomycetota bacterium]
MKAAEAIVREAAVCRDLAERIARPVSIMEVCGTHTVAICRWGLREILPPSVRLVSGPGCPVCVSTQGYIDALLSLAAKGLTVVTYGDMLRVPGSEGTLSEARAAGAVVLTVYSALEAVNYAAAHAGEQVVFAAVGFETTAPGTALALKAAGKQGLSNFSALFSHKRILPAMLALVAAPDLSIDGFLCPGHVSVITGPEEYESVAETGRPCVVAGFEGLDVAKGVRMILEQIAEGRAEVANEYTRAVKPGGNEVAQRILSDVFEVADEDWRGLGRIPQSGFSPRGRYAGRDAREVHSVEIGDVPEPDGCRCGEVIRGAIDPEDCPLFASRCTTSDPVGPCMVSREGSCSAHYRYARRAQ